MEPTSRTTTEVERDDAIAQALRTFVCSMGPAAADVRIEYAAGVVTVSGGVASATHLQAIENLLAAHDGVESIVSELRIVSAGVPAGGS